MKENYLSHRLRWYISTVIIGLLTLIKPSDITFLIGLIPFGMVSYYLARFKKKFIHPPEQYKIPDMFFFIISTNLAGKAVMNLMPSLFADDTSKIVFAAATGILYFLTMRLIIDSN